MSFGLSKKIKCNLGDKIIFLVFGVDGVTSHLSQDLSQIASLSNKKTKIIFIDDSAVTEDDTIEGKFLKSDIGRNRAIVTQKRCSSAFSDCEITAITRKVSTSEDILRILAENRGYTPVFIGCDSEEINNVTDEVIDAVYEVVAFRYGVDSEKGYCYFKYKHQGKILTDEFTDEERNHIDYFGFTSKIANIEISKVLFLYLDDFLCENTIRVCGTKVDTITKCSISKPLGDKLSDINMMVPEKEPFILNKSDKYLVILVGLGGTGGSLAYEVSHEISNLKHKDFKIMFIDGDIVENKNLNRQRFILRDVGSYKSAVTSNRCMNAYDIDIMCSTDYIVDKNELYNMINEFKGYTPIILGCSDSLKLRYLIVDAITNVPEDVTLPKDIIYIDAGNDTDGGQIICTIIKDGKEITTDFFKEFPETLADIDKQKLVTELSCDELMVSAPQTKGANMSAATGIYSIFSDIVNDRPIHSFNLTFGNRAKRVNIN